MSRTDRQRLDERMLADGLTETRSRAQGLIRAGRVLVNDTPIDKPGTAIRADARVRVRGEDRRFVSRGGEKLAGALEDLDIDPTDHVCLDIGASTGGFTDCLLQGGAKHVFAVDVGYGQLDARLRADPRVTVMERINARKLDVTPFDPKPDFITIDVSFISVRLLLPTLSEQLSGADLLIMVKPQFEVGRDQVGKGGVVRDPELRASAVAEVKQCAAELGWTAIGEAESRLTGPKGNQEIFVRFAPRSVDT
jgi:23S rRNA (cytidine1920-2'-O)/16S rRNA (cytidine1409-2'-O)-methyltransferase